MKTSAPPRRIGRKGFLLLESLLAFSIFGIAVTSIVVALHRTAELSQAVIHQQWIQHEAQNILREVLTSPRTGNDFARDVTFMIDASTEARILIEPFDAVDQDDNQLDNLYTVTVTIFWDNEGTQSEESYSTVHYADMFKGLSQTRR